MNTLSLCMIVKDEELALPRVLSVARLFADEVIVVDTGSTDGTVEIAQKAGCKVFDFEWIDDFSAARNYAFDKASCDYLMWLDADDVITESRAKQLAALKGTLDADVVMLPYYMGEPPSLVFYRERILRRNMGFKFMGHVHEAIEPRGKIIFAEIPIVHSKLKKSDPKRNLNILEKVLKEKGRFSGRETFYYGSELYYNGMNDDAEFWLNKFLTMDGSMPDKGQATLFLARIILGAKEKRNILIQGLYYAFSPDLICALGDSFLTEFDYKHAKACFLCALSADENITFPCHDCKKYLPHIRLCNCYWHLGDKEKSKYYNDLALIDKPNDPFAIQNSRLF